VRLQALREAVAAAGRQLVVAGLVESTSTSGNVSARDERTGMIAVSPSSIAYDRIQAADVPLVDAAGSLVEGGQRPSTELPMHLAVYQRRGDVGAVVHTHSPWATTWAVLGRQIPAVHYVISTIGYAIRVVPYATFGTRELAGRCADVLGPDNAVLLANHGVVAVGADLASALDNAGRVEFLAEVYWKATRAGEPVILSDAEIDRVRAQAAATRAGGSVPERDAGRPL
jgi:L-fuculose-phosphate aldolase